MSIRDKIEKIAREEAWAIASSMMGSKCQQISNDSALNGKIVSIDGQTAKVRLSDGREITATISGNRYLGTDDSVVIVAGIII